MHTVCIQKAYNKNDLFYSIYRDLKPENILVNASDCKVKITDFGLACGVRIDVDLPQKLTEYAVTRWYRAPDDYQIDTWTFRMYISRIIYTSTNI